MQKLRGYRVMYSLFIGNRYESKQLIGQFTTYSDLLSIFEGHKYIHDNKIFCHYYEILKNNGKIVNQGTNILFMSKEELRKISVVLGLK
jgi:hypothetical protein